MNLQRRSKKVVLLLAILIMALCIAIPVSAATEVTDLPQNSSGDNVVFGNNIHYNDRANGTTVAIGGNVRLDKGTNGDAVAIGGNVDIKDSANGNVVAIGGNTNVTGTVNGDVVAVGGDTTINGIVNGDVVAVGGKITLLGKSIVRGNVVGSRIQKDEDAVINGDTSNTIPSFKLPNVNGGFLGWQPIKLGFGFAGLFFTLIFVFLMMAIYPKGVETIARSVEKDTWRDLVVGIIASIVMFPLFITIIGIPLVIFLLLAAKMLGYAGVTLFIGHKFMHTINRDASSIYMQLLVGVLLLGFIMLFPLIGSLFWLVVFWISLGAMLDTKFGTGRPWFRRA